MDIIIAYLHFISIMTLMGSLITQHLVIKPSMNNDQIRSLRMIDLIYWISLVLILTTGILRWFVFGKGYDFYMSTPLFHIKITLFIILVILSIFPTRKILKWKRNINPITEQENTKQSVKSTLMFIRIELLIVAIMPLLAVMIARGM